MVTREDVARRAGVSTATVSNVLRGRKFVSAELSRRVYAAIEELGYVPNRAARSLASRRTDHVGILVPSLQNPYYGAVAEGMETVAREHGYIVSLVMAEGPSDQYIARIIERQMDGVFLSDYSFGFTPRQLHHMYERGVRFVVGGDSARSAATRETLHGARITVDYHGAMQDLFEMLYRYGHRRVAFLSGNDPAIHEARAEEFEYWRTYYRMDQDPNLFIPGNPPYRTLVEDGYRDMKQFLSRHIPFTALIALNDLMAIGALRAIREEGLRVPEDVSVIGCDNIYLSEITVPSLTTIHIPKYEIGIKAMEILMNMIEENEYEDAVLQAHLVTRESLGPAGKGNSRF
ncbi:MAG: LacI family transcriptional regulator [Treponemataceae bacterium]|nr:LacI family transcriptional regulator [Treponemataceae bacterium]